MRYFVTLTLLLLLAAVPAANTHAGVAEASTGISAEQEYRYDLSDMSPEQAEWFSMFIDGTFFCDGWQEISDDILVKMDDTDRDRQRAALHQLGYKIGREWSRDNNERKIDTSMLKKWGDILKETARDEPHLLAEVLRDIDSEVDFLLR